MDKRYIFFSTETCHYCGPQKELLHQLPEIEEMIEFKDALQNKEFCLSKGIRSVPALYDMLEDKVYMVGLFTTEDWKNTIK